MQKMFDEIQNKELSTLTYPNQDFRVLPDSAEKINEQSKEKEKFEKKTEESLNEEDEKILDEILLENKKRLMKSVTENTGALSEGEINKIASISAPTIDGKKQTVEERLQENVKKDNKKFLKRSSITLKLSPPKKNKKKPYDKE